jgi:LacI family transcriptional regulator
VSRVASRSAWVNPTIEKRVRAAAEKLGVSLQKRNSGRLIAFLLGNRSLLHPFHSQVLDAAEAYCAQHDYNLLFFPLHYPSNVSAKQLHIPRILERRDMIDGFIVSGVNTQNLLQLLDQTGVPFSVYANTVQGDWKPEDYDTVMLDEVTGAYEITRHLHSFGHTSIWYVANNKQAWFLRRHQGYLRAIKELGLTPLVSSLDSNDEHELGLLSTKHILQDPGAVEAIFGGSDAVCHGIYAALRDAGLEVPGHVSVAGFNDTLEATILHPGLTTVRAFPELIGRFLAEMVIDRINTPSVEHQHRTIPTQVIKRESCRFASSPARSFLSTRQEGTTAVEVLSTS